jgi:hypothetical protein
LAIPLNNSFPPSAISLQQSSLQEKKKPSAILPPAISLQPKNPLLKSLASSFSKSFISRGKQGG